MWFVGAALLASHYEGGVRFDRASGEGERQEELKKKKLKFLSSSAARPGEEERGTLSLKTTLFCSLFFFNIKWCRFGQNALFHLNMAPTHQLSNQSSIYHFFI